MTEARPKPQPGRRGLLIEIVEGAGGSSVQLTQVRTDGSRLLLAAPPLGHHGAHLERELARFLGSHETVTRQTRG